MDIIDPGYRILPLNPRTHFSKQIKRDVKAPEFEQTSVSSSHPVFGIIGMEDKMCKDRQKERRLNRKEKRIETL
jgi:hypothetical protein